MTDSRIVTTPLTPGTKLERNEAELGPNEKSLPYRELIGALMYLAVCTRPDIAYAVSYLSQFNCCYGMQHWTAAKRVLRYLQGTRSLGLKFRKTGRPLEGYVDADWANCPDDRRSIVHQLRISPEWRSHLMGSEETENGRFVFHGS